MPNKRKLIRTVLKIISAVFLYAISILSGGIVGELLFGETIGIEIGWALGSVICLSFIEKKYNTNKDKDVYEIFASFKDGAMILLGIIHYEPINDFPLIRKLFFLLMLTTYVSAFIVFFLSEVFQIHKTLLLTYMCDEMGIIRNNALIINFGELCQSLTTGGDVHLVPYYIIIFVVSLFISIFWFVFESYSLLTSNFKIIISNNRVEEKTNNPTISEPKIEWISYNNPKFNFLISY